VGERDLGHEHDHAALAAQRPRAGAQVDLGLPASGNAVEQEHLVPLLADGGVDLGHGLALGRGQLGGARRLDERGVDGGARDFLLPPHHGARVDECAQRRAARERPGAATQDLDQLEAPGRAEVNRAQQLGRRSRRQPVDALGARADPRRRRGELASDPAQPLEPVERGHGGGEARAQLCFQQRPAAEGPEHLAQRSARLTAFQCTAAGGQERDLALGARCGSRRGRSCERQSRGAERIGGGPQDDVEKCGRQHRSGVEHLQHGASRSLAPGRAPCPRGHDDADHAAPRAGHEHAHPGLRAEPLGQRVVQRLVQRQRHRHLDEAPRAHARSPLPITGFQPNTSPCATSSSWVA
jgi:hypothetical protein